MRVVKISVITIVIATLILLIGNSDIFGSNVYYELSNGDIRRNISQEVFEEEYENQELLLYIVLSNTVTESTIIQEISSYGDDVVDPRTHAVRKLYERQNNDFLGKLSLFDIDVRVSKYGPFIWIKLNNNSFEDIVEYANDVSKTKGCESVTIKVDALQTH